MFDAQSRDFETAEIRARENAYEQAVSTLQVDCAKGLGRRECDGASTKGDRCLKSRLRDT